MKIDYRELGRKVGGFFIDNAPKIAGYFIGAIACAACDRLGVRTNVHSFSRCSDDSFIPGSFQFLPRNAVENAITTIAQQAIEDNSWSSVKETAARKIFELADGKDDNTRTFAISALNAIAKSSNDGWCLKNRISDYIMRLGIENREE